MKTGLWHEWHSNGQLWQKGHYIKGKKDGEWKEYYFNAQIKFAGFY